MDQAKRLRWYVTRLKKMLIRFPNTPCNHCPMGKNYADGSNQVITSYEMLNMCKICQTFIHLKFIPWHKAGPRCPCNRIGPETAVKRALKYIAKYEEKHGEI